MHHRNSHPIIFFLLFAGIAGGLSLAQTNPPGDTNLVQDPENIIYAQLRSGDPQQRQAGTDSLRQIVQASPHRVINDIQKWIKPLMEANLHAEILQLTEQAIPLKAADASITSDQQYARAKALLALGEHERALAEAKSAYNVATQKHAERTVALMIEVLTHARGEAVAG